MYFIHVFTKSKKARKGPPTSGPLARMMQPSHAKSSAALPLHRLARPLFGGVAPMLDLGRLGATRYHLLAFQGQRLLDLLGRLSTPASGR